MSMRHPRLVEVLVDGEDRIANWTSGAELLFGYGGSSVRGRRLQEVLDGRDVFGNRLCRSACWLQEMFRHGETVQRFELDVRHMDGHRVRLVVEIEPAGRGRAQGWIYRFLPDQRQGDRRRTPVPAFPEARAAPPSGLGLTHRELDVLRLLARGAATGEVARGLGISPTTVRNHIQHIFAKLDVHTRLQAVSLALRHGLL